MKEICRQRNSVCGWCYFKVDFKSNWRWNVRTFDLLCEDRSLVGGKLRNVQNSLSACLLQKIKWETESPSHGFVLIRSTKQYKCKHGWKQHSCVWKSFVSSLLRVSGQRRVGLGMMNTLTGLLNWIVPSTAASGAGRPSRLSLHPCLAAEEEREVQEEL